MTGKCPPNWTKASLAEICSRIVDGSHNPPPASDFGKPMLSARNIVGSTINFTDFRLISDESFAAEHARTQVEANDVLLTIVGTIGRTAVVPERFPAFALQRSVAVLRPKWINARYLAHALDSPEQQQWLTENAKGTAQKGIYLKTLGTLEIPLAPLAEQTRIVAKLEELLSDLDAGVAELRAAQAKLAQYRQSLLKAAVEGALTADWRARHTPSETGAQLLARILAERRSRWESRQLARFQSQGKIPPKGWQSKYPEPVAPDTRHLPELPEGWVWATVEQLGDVQLGRQRSPDKLRGNSPTKYIRAANITERGIDFCDVLSMDFSDHEKEIFALHSGDVLLTEASGSAEHVGRPAIWPPVDDLYCFQNTVLRFSPRGVSSDFAYFSFLAMQKLGQFRKLSAGVGINHLSAGKFSKLPIALPPKAEQEELVRALRREFEHCDRQATALEQIRAESAAQRQNLLKAAFSGQLVPQDPADEPASALLERIRNQAAAPRSARTAGSRRRSPSKVRS